MYAVWTARAHRGERCSDLAAYLCKASVLGDHRTSPSGTNSTRYRIESHHPIIGIDAEPFGAAAPQQCGHDERRQQALVSRRSARSQLTRQPSEGGGASPPGSGHRQRRPAMSALCRYCSLISGLAVKFSSDHPCRAHCSLRGSRTRKAIGSLTRARTDSCDTRSTRVLSEECSRQALQWEPSPRCWGRSLGMWKARMEEDFLAPELGADAYGSYRRRVPTLIPFLPTR
jgi:hypothetical protein